ncbi:MAG: hypothetical protein AAF236_01790 [Verrucomicrobiota bacterium]
MKLWLSLLLLIVAAPVGFADQLSIHSLFSDGAVLQQGQPVPVWGSGKPGADITVRFGDREVSGTIADSGKWQLNLPALSMSRTPETLTVRSCEE